MLSWYLMVYSLTMRWLNWVYGLEERYVDGGNLIRESVVI